MKDQLATVLADKLFNLINGQPPVNEAEQLFLKGYRDAIEGLNLIKSFSQIEDFSDLDELEVTYWVTGYSVGSETREFNDKLAAFDKTSLVTKGSRA